MTRDDLLHALQSNNVQGFLRLIRQGESNQNDDAYAILFGGDHFDSFQDHPRRQVTKGSITSTAAGAYQILERTWDGLKHYGFADFSPASQDQAAVALIAGRGALQLVLDGRVRDAIARCAKEWASLPGSPYGQPTLTLETALEIYQAYGGTLEEAKQETSVIPRITEDKPMGIIAALIPMLGQLLPQLIPVLSQGHDSDEAHKWQGAGIAIANTLQDATKTDNLVQAIAAMQTNADALAAAHAAINNLLPSLVEAGGSGIDGARKANADPGQIPFYRQPSFYFLLGSLPLVYMLAASVLFGVGTVTWSDDAKMMVATGILAVLAGGSAYFWGSSSGSQKKTDALTAK